MEVGGGINASTGETKVTKVVIKVNRNHMPMGTTHSEEEF